MLRPLRLRLTLLYLLVALLLVAATGGSTYALLRAYLASTTDLALRYRMAQEFQALGAPLPPELAAAAAWRARPAARVGDDGDDGHDEHGEDTYDPELLAVFVLVLARDGAALPGGTAAPPDAPDRQALAAALAGGRDVRTARLGGEPVRLLTYRLPGDGARAVLQLGRPLGDQEGLLRRVLLGLLALGGAGTLLLGAGSWWLAGRSLIPLQRAWAQQREFVANAGHELRAPLTLLRASAEVALRRADPAEAGQRELLDDLLLLSRLDVGRLPLAREPIPLAPFLADAARQVARVAEERGVAVRAGGGGRRRPAAAAPGAPHPARQRAAAHPAGRAGRARRAARRSPRRDHRHRHRQRDRARAPAARLRPVLPRRPGAGEAAGGSGLGLAIARALVTAQGGDIRLVSAPGQGTRVTVTLPAAPAGQGEEA